VSAAPPDSLCPRCNLLDALDRLISLSTAHFRAAEIGQLSLFGGATGVSERLEMPASVEGVPVRQQLTWEKELLGVYISDHPLAPYIETLAQVVTHFSAELGDADHGQAVTVAGEVATRPYQTYRRWIHHAGDLQGSIELVVQPRGRMSLPADARQHVPYAVTASAAIRRCWPTRSRESSPWPAGASFRRQRLAMDELPQASEVWSPEQAIEVWSGARDAGGSSTGAG
jgi:DNA polymerase III alpha subunit